MLYNDDCIKVMTDFDDSIIDLVFADPPYFLSNDGKSISSGNVVSVNKGEWDKKENYCSVEKFTEEWLRCCFRILKDRGTIWVSGTSHNIFDVKRAMAEIGFKVINIIIWQKLDPPPLIYKNKFRFSYEFIIWARKGYSHYFNYEKMFNVQGREMADVWTLPAVSMSEKRFGRHPTQKPECLLKRIILASSKEGDLVLDPFMGSGTTCVVARQQNRRFIGIEKEIEYFKFAKKRIENTFLEKNN